MDPICISAAAVLRCSSLTTKQNIIFIVPVALEFLVSCLLFFLKWGSGKLVFLSFPNHTELIFFSIGRQHLLLVTEGWTYFILSLLELHSVVLFPLSSGNINQFRSFDIGIGEFPVAFIESIDNTLVHQESLRSYLCFSTLYSFIFSPAGSFFRPSQNTLLMWQKYPCFFHYP